MHHPTDRIAHTTAFVAPVVEYWLELEIAQCVHHGSARRQINESTRNIEQRDNTYIASGLYY